MPEPQTIELGRSWRCCPGTAVPLRLPSAIIKSGEWQEREDLPQQCVLLQTQGARPPLVKFPGQLQPTKASFVSAR